MSAAAARARAWHHHRQALICDIAEPWAHGTILRATRFPDYYDFNLVRVEEKPAIGVRELVTIADEALEGAAHRRVDFDDIDPAAALRDGFEALGWHALRILYMVHVEPPPPAPTLAVEEVDYDAVADLRLIWHAEDFPGTDPGEYHEQARAVSRTRGARVFAVCGDDRTPVAYAQLEQVAGSAEIAQVFVHPEHRRRGIGTALTRASIEAAGPVDDLWITADDEDRAKDLYARLGFRPAWLYMELTRRP